jgi:hypothetical protein
MSSDSIRKTIFYSWQSDLPTSGNRAFIRAQLRHAVNTVEEAHPEISFEIDEATRDLPGSPHIPTAIQEKIREADFFVCDVSTINATDPNARKCPNPNVVFELGFAVATLGWGRIVMLTNTRYGTLADLPFDFDRHRASDYAADAEPTAKQKKHLRELLEAALDSMVRADPERPGAELTPEQKRRRRDIANLTELLSVVHIPTIDQHLEDAPRRLFDRAIDYWEYFRIVIDGSRFHLYDERVREVLQRFRNAYHETVRNGEYYHPTLGHKAYIFTNPGDLPLTGSKAEAWDAMSQAVNEMGAAFWELLSLIRTDYIEIDLEETSAAAWQLYRSHQRDLLDQEDLLNSANSPDE